MKRTNVSVNGTNISMSELDTSLMRKGYYYLTIIDFKAKSGIMVHLYDAANEEMAHGLANDVLEYVTEKSGFAPGDYETSVFEVLENSDEGFFALTFAGSDFDLLLERLEFIKKDITITELEDGNDLIGIEDRDYVVTSNIDLYNIEENCYYAIILDSDSSEGVIALLLDVEDEESALASAEEILTYMRLVCGFNDENSSIIYLINNKEEFICNHIAGINIFTLYNDFTGEDL